MAILSLFALAVGIFSTSRLVFLVFPLLLSAFFWKFNRKKAVVFLMLSVSVAFALHGYFYVTNDFYQPLHLLEKGEKNVGSSLSIFGLLATSIAFAAVYRRLENTLESWLLSAFICISIPLAFISLGDFIHSGLDFSNWEGANYLIPGAPLFTFYLAIKLSSKPHVQEGSGQI